MEFNSEEYWKERNRSNNNMDENSAEWTADDREKNQDKNDANLNGSVHTEPLEEHPENNNFKVKEQQGAPDYDKANAISTNESTDPKPEKVERGDGENDRPHKGGSYRDEDESENIPGPEELPDQQKVGEDVDDETFKKDHIET